MLVTIVTEMTLAELSGEKEFMQLAPMVRDKGFVVLGTPDF